MAEIKLDIFRVLNEIDKKNINFYSSLTEDEQKAFAPKVVARWLSGTYNKQQVYFINEIVNPFVFSLYKHPGLLYQLMTLCTTGKPQRYIWSKALSKTPSNPFSIKAIQQYFGYNSEDAQQSIQILSPEDIVIIAETMGWQDEDLNKMRKELGLKPVKTSSRISKKTTNKVIDSDFEF